MFINKWKYIVAQEFNGFRAHVDNSTVLLEKIPAKYNGIARLRDDISITQVGGLSQSQWKSRDAFNWNMCTMIGCFH